MKNENVTITLPKEKYDSQMNLIQAQEKQLKELLAAKEDDIIVVNSHSSQNLYRSGYTELPVITSGNEEKVRELLFEDLQFTKDALERFSSSNNYNEKLVGSISMQVNGLKEIIENYNSLPWWKKIFTFSL